MLSSALSLCLALCLAQASLPSTWKVCKVSETEERNKCLQEAIQDALEEMAKGEPVSGVGKIEPLELGEVKINTANGPVSFNITYSNATFHNLSPFSVHDVKSDLKTHKLEFKLKLSKDFRLNSNLEMNGKILILPVKGKGTSDMRYENMDLYVKLALGTKDMDGKKVYYSKKTIVDFTASRVKFNSKNVQHGKALEEAFNRMLNDNWKMIVDETRPSMSAEIGKSIGRLANMVLSTIEESEIDL